MIVLYAHAPSSIETLYPGRFREIEVQCFESSEETICASVCSYDVRAPRHAFKLPFPSSPPVHSSTPSRAPGYIAVSPML
jgi:hypothetical protein